jgi:hypothetical protein
MSGVCRTKGESMWVIQLIRTLRGLVKVPSIEDETELRHFLARVLDAVGPLAAYTPTKLDDLGVAALRTIVMNDAVWQAFYRLIKFAAGSDDLPALVSATGLNESQILLLRDTIYDQANSAGPAGGPGSVA